MQVALQSWGFTRVVSNVSLFVKRTFKFVLFLLVYIDDILITGLDNTALRACVHDLETQFALKTLGSISYFLGFEAYRDHSGIYLTQSKYNLDLLQKATMLDCKPCATPINTTELLTNEGDHFPNPSLFRIVVGSLQYLTYTRPDIAFAINKLSQFLSAPKQQHWLACKRLLRYLKGTIGLGLFFSPSSKDLPLIVYTDADHAGY